ncbi:MAG: Holliday junction resolvase RuvX [Candidatus Limnocylindria bacterium]
MTRIIGLDHGSRRIGVAVGDTETGIAFARPAVRTRSSAAAAEAVRRLADDEHATTVVIGLPYLTDGSEGQQAALVRAFGERLRRIGLDVAYEDERLSSWAAGQGLAEGGRRPSRESGEIDSAAARLILQQYLDARPSPGPSEETT